MSRTSIVLFVVGIIPEFLGKIDETQYGVEGRMSQIVLRLRAYPTPKITWHFHNKKSVLPLPCAVYILFCELFYNSHSIAVIV